MRLVFASNNKHKLDEVRAIMPAGIDVLSLREIGFEQEIEENGTTLEANSRIKAETVWEWINRQSATVSSQIDGVFADDTGLEIDALNGRPGVYTARWYLDNGHGTMDNGHGTKDLGEKEIFAANRAKALRELAGKTNRGAQFKTVVTLIMKLSAISSQHSDIQVKGIVRGRIATEEHGDGGFGYDPLFIPEGYDRTFAELPAEVKNSISHRARAMQELVQTLHKIA